MSTDLKGIPGNLKFGIPNSADPETPAPNSEMFPVQFCLRTFALRRPRCWKIMREGAMWIQMMCMMISTCDYMYIKIYIYIYVYAHVHIQLYVYIYIPQPEWFPPHQENQMVRLYITLLFGRSNL